MNPTSSTKHTGFSLYKQETLDNCPSKKRGLSTDEIEKQFRDAVQFIQQTGVALDIPIKSTNCAVMILHRFFAQTSIQTYADRIHDICRACVFSACKIEETPRRIRDVMNVTYRIAHPNETLPIPMTDSWVRWKTDIIALESLIFDKIKFEFNAVHPHQFVLHCCNELKASQQLASVSWAICNDVMHCRAIVLQYLPHQIATAAINVASELLSHAANSSSPVRTPVYYPPSTTVTAPSTSPMYDTMNSGNNPLGTPQPKTITRSHTHTYGTREPNWWKKFDISEYILHEISAKILDLYESPHSKFESDESQRKQSMDETQPIGSDTVASSATNMDVDQSS